MSSQLYQSVLHNTTLHSAKQRRLKQGKTAAVLIIEILPSVYSSRQAKHQHLRSIFLHKYPPEHLMLKCLLCWSVWTSAHFHVNHLHKLPNCATDHNYAGTQSGQKYKQVEISFSRRRSMTHILHRLTVVYEENKHILQDRGQSHVKGGETGPSPVVCGC